MKKLFLIFNLVFAFVVIRMLNQTYNIYKTKKNIITEIQETEKKVTEYTEKKAKIENDIKNFSEEEKIEKVARAKLNFKKEGEVVYRMIEQ